MADKYTTLKDIKHLTFWQKIEHIWEYYRLTIALVACGVFMLGYFVYRIICPGPEFLMNIAMSNVNTLEVAEKDVFMRYLEARGYSLEEYAIGLNTGLMLDDKSESESVAMSYQALAAQLLVGELDLFVGAEYAFDGIQVSNGLHDLEKILPKEQVEKYKDRFYYYEDKETGKSTACGIWMGLDDPLAQDKFYFTEILVGIPATTKNLDMAVDLLVYMLEE